MSTYPNLPCGCLIPPELMAGYQGGDRLFTCGMHGRTFVMRGSQIVTWTFRIEERDVGDQTDGG